ERFTISLARALDRAQVEPILAGLWQWDPIIEEQWRNELTSEGLRVMLGPHKNDAAALWNFVDSVRSIAAAAPAPVDIIHSECDFGDLVALLLKRRLGARVVVRTAHNEREWAKRPWRRVVFTGGLFPLVYGAELGVSRKVVENLDRRPLARVLQRRTILAYNALDLGRFEEIARPDVSAFRASLGIPRDAYLIGSVGRLVTQKGFEVLLESAVSVLAERPEAYFVVVGGGELAHILEDKARRLGIAGRVCFTGPRQDVDVILSALDLFVSASLWEGLPTVILEAMAANVPVVATNVSGTVELVQDGLTGTLVRPGDPSELARAILQSKTSPGTARAMAVRAREHVLQRFDIRAVARQHEALYRRLLQTAETGDALS
ncbi:MAG: glycosyltransferase, partial [Nitrososphaerales archaeon]